ncbi:TssQ family T6SS-associated lipoprotein [Orrella sp. JC864]|uniref:TssQ family T6SS-associated lipoprotein n=1 Tax=Orrella sp. JC864 TaxID=3120298 RepID=UPI00300B9CAE
MKSLALLCIPVLLAAGCAQTPNRAAALDPGVDTPESQRVLEQVRQDYAQGRYGNVVRTVTLSTELEGASRATRVEAYKLQAFSYCVRDYRQLCEESFVRALMLQPDFELAPAERGHPQWGPAFEAAQALVTP